ncbi:MAG: class I SAM-dependent methyltransferase [Chloroherpetonaceae bacterium]|nr:class I SAM-dependent methyltransferase [Chthonomonadaceae bacterium]MDW8207552.1 class I SAM-dependent methyltransferase [Chloroherpetonaceae bacterium]
MNVAEYERMYRLEDTYWWFVARHRLIQAILRQHYGIPRASCDQRLLLDVGCGTGAMSCYLSQWGKVVSADFSHLALQFSAQRGLKHLVGADAMRLPFRAATFDAIIALDLLEHLPDDRAALCEFHRVLKPDGMVCALVPAYPHLWSEHDIALMHHRRYVRRELGERFISAGFQIQKLSHTMTLLYPVVALQRRLLARKTPRIPPQAAMPCFPEPVNAALTWIVTAENALARRLNFPFGVSILCVACKSEPLATDT